MVWRSAFIVVLVMSHWSWALQVGADEPPAATATQASTQQAAEAKWEPLFNGQDLTGWTPKIRYCDLGDNYGETFRVEDGLLKVRYDKYAKFDERFGHLFYKEPLSNYRLRVEYRFVSDQVAGGPGWAQRNSGVMIHGQSAESMAKDQDFPASIEVQLLGGLGAGPRPTANLCTPYTHVVMDNQLIKRHCTSSHSETYEGDGWVVAEIEVRGNEVIRHWINGKVVLEYNQPQLDDSEEIGRKLIQAGGGEVQLSGGTISLQSESHPVDFRRVELLRLSGE